MTVTPCAPRAGRTRAHLTPVVAACLLAGVLTAAPASAAPDPGGPGYGDPYFPLDGNRGLDVLHYDVHDRYRFHEGLLDGHTTLTVRARQDLSAFNLDFLLPVHGVRVDGVAAEVSRPRGHEVHIEPATPVLEDEEFTVRVSYGGRPARYSYAGESNWLADRHEVVAMNQPHMAPWWFPSNDHPADKARMDISITVPLGKQVVANGRPVSRDRRGDRVTHHWRAREPMATYLAMFAAGPFHVETDTVAGLPYRFAVSRRLRDSHYRASLRMLRQTPAVVRELEHALGAYPFATAGGLVTSLPVGFALENQTIPTYFGVGSGDWDWLVVHEQAHQWFGNSVGLRRWRDIWLNEGAATFMEVRHENWWDQTADAWLQEQYRIRHPESSFWNTKLADPGPKRIFVNAVYFRGAMTFQALRNRIGNEDFWRLLRRWLRVNEGGTGTTPEFTALAEQVSGKRLDGFFDAWIRTTSRPEHTRANGLE